LIYLLKNPALMPITSFVFYIETPSS